MFNICYSYTSNVIYSYTSYTYTAIYTSTQSKHSTIALDLNRRTSSFRPLLFRNLPTTLPSRSFQDLSKCKLCSRQLQILANQVSNAIALNSKNIMIGVKLRTHSSTTVKALHSAIAGWEVGIRGSPDLVSTGRASGLRVKTPKSTSSPPGVNGRYVSCFVVIKYAHHYDIPAIQSNPPAPRPSSSPLSRTPQ